MVERGSIGVATIKRPSIAPAMARPSMGVRGGSEISRPVKSQFATPPRFTSERNAPRQLGAYAPKSEFSKPAPRETNKAPQSASIKTHFESVLASRGSNFQPITSEQIPHLQAQASEQAMQALRGNPIPAGQEAKGQIKVDVKKRTVEIVSIDKPNPVARSTENDSPQSAPDEKQMTDTVSVVKAQPKETPTTDSTQVSYERFHVHPETEFSSDTTGRLSQQEIQDLVQQQPFTGEAQRADGVPNGGEKTVQRLPDIKAVPPEVINPVETVQEVKNVLETKQSTQQVSPQVDSDIIGTTERKRVIQTEQAPSKPIESVVTTASGGKPIGLNQNSEVHHADAVRQVAEVVVSRDVDQKKPAEVATTSIAEEGRDTMIPDAMRPPINPAETAQEIIAEAPQVEEAMQQQSDTAEKRATIIKELQRIQERQEDLKGDLRQVVDVEVKQAEHAKKPSAQATAKDSAQVGGSYANENPKANSQPENSGAKFLAELREREDRRENEVHEKQGTKDEVKDPTREDVNGRARTVEDLTVAVSAKFKKADAKAKDTAKSLAAHADYIGAIDWDELFKKKKKKSAYEETIQKEESKTEPSDRVTIAAQNTQNSFAQLQGAAPLPLPVRTEDNTGVQIQETVTPEPSAQAAGQTLAAQQEATLTKIVPQTQPITMPEQTQQLQEQAVKEASSQLGAMVGTVLFTAGEDGKLQLTLDKNARDARKKALEEGVMNAPLTPEGTVIGSDVVAAATKKHTDPLLSAAVKAAGEREDGGETTIWNRITEIGELSTKEMLAEALKREEDVRPVAIAESGGGVDERDLFLALSKVKKNELDLAA